MIECSGFKCGYFVVSLLYRFISAQSQSVPVQCVIRDTAGEKSVFLFPLRLAVHEKQSERGDGQKQTN